MADVLTCPFCNAMVANTTGTDRVACSRCGESFSSAGRTLSEGLPLPERLVAYPASRYVPIRWPFYVLGVMLAMGIVGVIANQLNLRKLRNNPSSNPSSHAIIKPSEMPGLGYVPENCEAILAIQLPAFLEKMGPEAQKDPVEAIARLGFPRSLVEAIDSASGVGLKNVEQMVVGIGFERGAFPPQLFVTVHTREPYDLDALVKKRKGAPLKKDGRTLHAVKSNGVPEVLIWSPNNRVLVGTLLARDFEAIPMQPRSGIGHLKPPLTGLMKERVAEDASFWFVALSDQWAKYIRPYTWLPGSPLAGRDDLIGPADRLRTVAISLPQPAEKRVEVRIDQKSAEAATRLREIYQERFSGEEITVGGEGDTILIATDFEPQRVGSLLSRLVVEKK